MFRRSRRPFTGRFIRPGSSALSFDIAQILAPGAAVPANGATSPPSGTAPEGDFAALLGGLGGAAPVPQGETPAPTGPAPGMSFTVLADSPDFITSRGEAVQAAPTASASPTTAASLELLGRLTPWLGLALTATGEEKVETSVMEPADLRALPDEDLSALAAEGGLLASLPTPLINPVASPVQGSTDGEPAAESSIALTSASPGHPATEGKPALSGIALQPASAGHPAADAKPALSETPEPVAAAPGPVGLAQMAPPPSATATLALSSGILRVTGQFRAAESDPAQARVLEGGLAVEVASPEEAGVSPGPAKGAPVEGAPPQPAAMQGADPAAPQVARPSAAAANALAPDAETTDSEAETAVIAGPQDGTRVAETGPQGASRQVNVSKPEPSSPGVDDIALKPLRAEAEASGGPAATLAAPVGPDRPEGAPAPARASATTISTLAEQMTRRLDGGSTRFDLELNPAGLGRVDVRLDIDSMGGIRAAFTFDTPQAASEMSRRADELQKSLESSGFNLTGGLSFDVAGDRSQGRHAAWTDGRDARPNSPPIDESDLVRETGSTSAEALKGRGASSHSGVDIRI